VSEPQPVPIFGLLVNGSGAVRQCLALPMGWSHPDSPSAELIGRRVTVGVSQLAVCLQYDSEGAGMVVDLGDEDMPMATAGNVRHTSTFDFWTWKAGVTHALQGHLSPT